MNKANENVRFRIQLKLKSTTYKESFIISGTGAAIWSETNREKWDGWGTTVILFLAKNSLVKKEVHCCDAKPSSFVTKLRGKLFAHFTQSS
jgi:hypothetical protein